MPPQLGAHVVVGGIIVANPQHSWPPWQSATPLQVSTAPLHMEPFGMHFSCIGPPAQHFSAVGSHIDPPQLSWTHPLPLVATATLPLLVTTLMPLHVEAVVDVVIVTPVVFMVLPVLVTITPVVPCAMLPPVLAPPAPVAPVSKMTFPPQAVERTAKARMKRRSLMNR
jgi:hypothetical protein